MVIIVNRDKKLGDCSSWPIWSSKPDHFDWKYDKEEMVKYYNLFDFPECHL